MDSKVDSACSLASRTAFFAALHPLTEQEFFAQYWEKHPKLIAGASSQLPSYGTFLKHWDFHFWSAIKSSGGTCEAFSSEPSRLAPTFIRFDTGSDGYSKSRELLREGYTLRLTNFSRHVPELETIRCDLSRTFHAPISANAYLTPAHSASLGIHYDNYCVLVLQLVGSKNWELYDRPVELPLRNISYSALDKDLEHQKVFQIAPGDPGYAGKPNDKHTAVLETRLDVGQAIYIPRGHLHQACTKEEISLHITFGIRSITWLDLVTSSARLAAQSNSRLRKGVPPEYLDPIKRSREGAELLRTVWDNLGVMIDAEHSVDIARRRLLVDRPMSRSTERSA